jgi:hypothetical protein
MWGLLVAAATLGSADTIVVCPAPWRETLQPWIEYRQHEGHSFVFLEPPVSDAELADAIRECARREHAKFLVLVGDADEHSRGKPGNSVPTRYVPAKINVKWGSEPTIPSDNAYADLDDDGKPDLAVGRISVDTPEQLAAVLEKTLRYETSADFGPWRRRVDFIGGMGGFGAFADAAIESAAKKLVTDSLAPEFTSSLTFASWQSPYCPAPSHFSSTTIDKLNRGCLFWVYIGHGSRRTLDWLMTPKAYYPILVDKQIRQVKCQHGAPIMLCFACYTAAFDDDDCLGEQLLRAPEGPVAVFGGTRVTMPYAMAVLGRELMTVCFSDNAPATLGEAIQRAKRQTLEPPKDDPFRQSLDAMATLVSPAPDQLVAERTEHVHLLHLLGDPLIKLKWPQRAEIVTPTHVAPGETMTITLGSPFAGHATVELSARRDRLLNPGPPRGEYDEHAAEHDYDAVYLRANDLVLDRTEVDITREATVTLTVPANASGPCNVTAFIEAKTACAAAGRAVEIETPKAKPSR